MDSFPFTLLPSVVQEEVLLRAHPPTLLRAGVRVSQDWADIIRAPTFWRRLAQVRGQGFPPEALAALDRLGWREAAEVVLAKPFRWNLLAFDPDPWNGMSCGKCWKSYYCDGFFDSLSLQNLTDEEMVQRVNESFPANGRYGWIEGCGHCHEIPDYKRKKFWEFNQTCIKLLPFVDLQLAFKKFIRATDANPMFSWTFVSKVCVNWVCRNTLGRDDFDGQKWRLATLGPFDLAKMALLSTRLEIDSPFHFGFHYEVMGTRMYLIAKKK